MKHACAHCSTLPTSPTLLHSILATMGGAEGKGKKGKAAAGARKKWWPGGPRKKQQKLAAKKLQGKGKAEAPPPAPAAHKGET